jgi:hypothetical protein
VALGVFSLLNGIDAMQTLLMASPVLSATSLAAFSFILDSSVTSEDIRKVNLFFSIVVIFFPLLLLVAIVSILYLFWIQIDGFGPDQLKISLGGIETFFGVFLGAIARSLFGKEPRPSSS